MCGELFICKYATVCAFYFLAQVKCTPLHLAAENGDIATCQVLLDNGAHPDTHDNVRDSALHSMHLLYVEMLELPWLIS